MRVAWLVAALTVLPAAGYGALVVLGRMPTPLAEVAAAPEWAAGDSWNYTFLSGGSIMGWTRREVTGTAEVNGEQAYVVRETSWRDKRWDAAPTQGPATVRTRWYDADSLNEVWDLCHVTPWLSMSPCQGRTPFLHFPLWEGKRWTFPCCGDVINDLDARVARDDAGRWVVPVRCETCAPGGAEVVRYLYDADLRSIVEERTGRGEFADRLVLQQ